MGHQDVQISGSHFGRSLTTSVVGGHATLGATAVVGGFPDATNTGSAAGDIGLSVYSGTTHFDSGVGPTTISNMIIGSAADPVGISMGTGGSLTLINCHLYGIIDNSIEDPGTSYSATDCTLDAGSFEGPVTGYYNYTLTRCNVTGGKDSCNVAGNNTLTDCYLHGQNIAPTSEAHCQGILCSGGDSIMVNHCNVGCDATIGTGSGGPTASISMFGDFATCTNITVQNCLIRACQFGAYSVYWGWDTGKTFGSNPANIMGLNNTYTRRSDTGFGGQFGTNTAWLAANGDTYTGNIWQDTGLPVLITE